VVGIHEGGTRCAAGGAGTPKGGGNTDQEWTLRGFDRRQGTNADETQERRIRRLIQDESGALKVTPSSGRSRSVLFFASTNERTRRRKTPRTTWRHERSWGEQRSSNELLLRLIGCGSTVRENGVSVPSLEGQANTTSAVVEA
jgi:hypothetical protein